MSDEAGGRTAAATAGAADTPPATVRCTVDDGVALVLLDRPERRNALSQALLDELLDVLARCNEDTAVRALILSGAGPVFCAGADLSAIASLPVDEQPKAFAPLARSIASRIRTVMQALLNLPKPVVAAVNGHAVGGGLLLMLGSDLRLVDRGACAWMPELGFGRAIGTPSMNTFIECVGPLRAKDIVLGGERLGADRLLQLGLASAVLATDQLLAQARAKAVELARADPQAVARNKARANQHLIDIWNGVDD